MTAIQCMYTVAQKGHVHYQFQHLQLPILSFLITNFQLMYFSLPISNFLIFDFQYVATFLFTKLSFSNVNISNFQF